MSNSVMVEPLMGGNAAAAPPAWLDAVKRAIRAGQWDAGLNGLREAQARGDRFDASARLLGVIARIRSSNDYAAIDELNDDLIRQAQGRIDLRRLAIGPLIKATELAAAASVLNALVLAYPDSAEDRRTYASVLARLKRWDEAIDMIDEAARLDPADMSLLCTRIQWRLQTGRIEPAAAIARQSIKAVAKVPDEAHLWITALLRCGDTTAAASLAATIEATHPRVASAVVRALVASGRITAAIASARKALHAGHDSAELRSQLAQAHLARGTRDDHQAAALEQLAAGLALAPDNLRLNSLYGETLARAGRFEQSLAFLEKSCTLAPELENLRTSYARALRYAGRLGDAADQWVHLARRAPARARWQRAAAAALTHAGRTEEAAALFNAYAHRCAEALPETFADALAQLPLQTDSAAIPQARLDWAWDLRTGNQNQPIERAEWERAARWGHLADRLLLDWLECRYDHAEQAMELLAELDETERFMAPLVKNGCGLVIATAHVGPMYAGLMALELLNVRAKWLASTPSVAMSHYAGSLISTGDKSEMQVMKASMEALQAGYAVYFAVDGALNPAAARVPFENQEITYSSFAARASYRLGVPSVFLAPRWERNRIVHTLEMLPVPCEGETIEDYASRWQNAYFVLLRAHLGGRPENLRLSGGIWRHIRSL
jgi:predicted Zn-dependent protease